MLSGAFNRWRSDSKTIVLLSYSDSMVVNVR